MSGGVQLRGTVLSEPQAAALDRVLPRLLEAFEAPVRQRIAATLAHDRRAETPGYAQLADRLRALAPGAAAGARMRRGRGRGAPGPGARGRVVTHQDVVRLMEALRRSAGAEASGSAIERLRADDGLLGDAASAGILDLCLSNLAGAEPDPAGPGENPLEPPESLALDFDEPYPGERDRLAEAEEGAGWPTTAGSSASHRAAEAWDARLKTALNGPPGDALSELAGTMQVGLVTGFRGDGKLLAQALGATLAGGTHQPVLGLVLVDEEALLKTKAHNTPAKAEALVRALLEDGNGVVYATPGGSVPPFVDAAAVRRRAVGDLRGTLFGAVEDLARTGLPLRRESGGDAAAWMRETLRGLPPSRAVAVRAWLRRAYEEGAVDPAAEETLERLAHASLAAPAPAHPGPATLAEMRGLAAPTRERLLRIASRLRDPAGADVGLLLVGEPGTGKTLLASLLARESGRHFVRGSVPEWQSAGYLNDFLAAMRASFDEARRNAPSLLFIDEADALGQRGGGGHRNDEYWNMVVTAMLELLGGLGPRGDVAVIAATNHPELIDPAILREGRLGERLDVPRPDRAGRAEILGALVPEAAAIGLDVGDLADRLGPCPAAAVEGIVKEARRLAREAGAPLAARHFEGALAVAVRAAPVGRALRAVCIGLAAEAAMTRLAYGESAPIVSVSALPGIADPGRVVAGHPGGEAPLDTAGDRLRALHVALAPAAGRRLVASAGGRPRADALDCFTHLAAGESRAVEAHALALVASGVLGSPAALAEAPEALARRVAAQSWVQVCRALTRALPGIEALAGALAERGRVDGDEAAALLAGDAPEPDDGPAAPTLH